MLKRKIGIFKYSQHRYGHRNYIEDVNETSTTIDVSGYAPGIYAVVLVCDGEIVDSKNLAKQ